MHILIPTIVALTTVYSNAKVFTANAQQPYATAIAIKDGKVLAVGSDAEVIRAAGHGAKIVDLGGHTVIPGLNDAHVHVLVPDGVHLNDNSFIPGPGPTLSDVKALIAGAQGVVPPGTWLLVLIGTAVLDDPASTRDALDPVSPSTPVWLQGWSGHGTVLNTAAIKSLGLTEDEPNPFGGRYGRYPGTDILDGTAHEYAEFGVWRQLFARMTDAALISRYQAAAATAIQFGFTSWQDMAVGVPHDRALRVLRAANLPMRVRSMCFPFLPGEECELDGEKNGVTGSGIKWISDGTPIERGSYLDEDYADRPGVRGVFNLPREAMPGILLRGLLGPAQRNQLLFHTVGDGALDTVLGALTDRGTGVLWRGRRTRIEHADLLFAGNFSRMRDAQAMVVQNPRHLSLAAVFAERFTPEIFAQLEPLRSLAAQGIPLALGTDSIGGAVNPWIDVMLAAIHPTHPSEALTVEEAITAFTRGSAYAEFAENQKGTLAPGMQADLAVLSQDPFSVPIPQLPATYSLLTLVGGKAVWDTGTFH
jgi:predicted amidohydrolase YtcJ